MDLQLQRQTELWLRLMGETKTPAALRISFSCGNNTYYIEQQNKRTFLFYSRSISEERSKDTLFQLLNIINADACLGIPMRAWITKGKIWISATAPPVSGAELWANLSNQQRRLFDRVLGSSYEKN